MTCANNFATGELLFSLKYIRGSTTYTDIKFTEDDYDSLENTIDTPTFSVDLGFVLKK